MYFIFKFSDSLTSGQRFTVSNIWNKGKNKIM